MSLKVPDFDPERDVQIDPNDLAREFRQISSVIYRYLLTKLDCQQELDEIREVYETQRARKLIEATKFHVKLSAKQIEAHLDIDDDLKMIAKRVRDAEYQVRYIEATIESLKIKEKMIMQLGADARRP